MSEVVEFVVSLIGGIALVLTIVLFDERRLSPEQLDRAWPSTTRVAAAVAFGPLCLPVHFWRTRRSFVGVVIGIGFALLVLAINTGLSLAVDAALD